VGDEVRGGLVISNLETLLVNRLGSSQVSTAALKINKSNDGFNVADDCDKEKF